MEIKNNKSSNKKQKNIYHSMIAFAIAAVFFISGVYSLSLASEMEAFTKMGAVLYALMFFILSMIMVGVTISNFLKYILREENVLINNIPVKAAIGVILISLIIVWRIIGFVITKDIIVVLQLSLIEWVIVIISIILIVFGIPKKAR